MPLAQLVQQTREKGLASAGLADQHHGCASLRELVNAVEDVDHPGRQRDHARDDAWWEWDMKHGSPRLLNLAGRPLVRVPRSNSSINVGRHRTRREPKCASHIGTLP